MNTRPTYRATRLLAVACLALLPAALSHAQEGDNTEPARSGAAAPVAPSRTTQDTGNGLTGTRPELDGELVPINFKDRTVEDFIPLIVDYTGKAVINRAQALGTAKISIQSERLVTKHEALNLIFQAFRLNGIGVVENADLVMIDSLTGELTNLQPGLILGPEVDVSQLDEDGQIVTKVFRLRYAKAADIENQIENTRPAYANITADVNSNQLIIEGDVAWAKRVQKLLDLLDVPPFLAVKTETFRLAYSDAQTIADIVLELFSPNPNSSSGGGARSSRGAPTRGRTPAAQQNQELPQVGTSQQLQVSVLPQTNSITVRAEPEILTDIRFLIESAWDIPPSREGNIFRLYDLKYTDPVKVKNLLATLLETGGGSSAPAGRTGGNAASGGADAAVADIFRIEAYPDSNRLVVISKTPDNFNWLDGMIDQIDQPLTVGLPVNVELKHASAIDVADILNTLLAQAGGGGRGIRLPEEGLSGIDFATAGGGEGGTGGSEQSSEEITFPWQSGRGGQGDEAAEVSALVGKSRVVPNPGQNSLLVLATPEIQDALLGIIEDLDRPGRQVMITTTLAEVTLGDGLSLGIRVGSGISASGDNTVNGRVGLDLTKGNGTGTGDNPGVDGGGGNFANPWFDTSFLDVGTTVDFVLSALSQSNNVRILQRPRVFTSDNREAKFFSGQDVTFQTGSTTNDAGTTTAFEQEAIGIGLNVRPRITAERNVAMEIEVLLSTLANEDINNNPVVNRRQTTTSVTVKNNQTIVISGIRKEDDQDVVRKVPFFGDIPGLGALFTSTDKAKQLSELVIFVTPIVVDNPDENDENFNKEDVERLDELSKPLEEMSRGLVNTTFFDRMDDEDEDAPATAPAGNKNGE
ncbi:MAG: hypothetical protein GY895_04805 [Phycisphaera sp.]|nr:hypothetical protein [Phycisphaera sp.]